MTRSTFFASTRRAFVAGALGASLGWALLGRRGQAQQRTRTGGKRPPADHCVILTMNGGMAQTDTFDPKPGTRNAGPLAAIDTAAPGLRFSELLPRLAGEARELAVIRSMVTSEGAHERARYLLHTGYAPSGTVRHPDLGALVAQGKHDEEFDLPAYVAVGGGGLGAGVLGVGYEPFRVADPRQPVENLSYAPGVNALRWQRRRKLLTILERRFLRRHPGEETRGHTQVYERADRLMHAAEVEAFSLAREPSGLREAYGQNPFGQGCLLARRLVEAGVPAVEVQLGGWDTHQDNFTRNRELAAMLDAGLASLLHDLRERDLLRKTLVLVLSEFGRTPGINANEGRDHWTRGWSVVLAGGPVRGGQAVGATGRDGTQGVERPVGVPDLFASIFRALGIDPARVNETPNGRPIRAVDAGGKVVGELFA